MSRTTRQLVVLLMIAAVPAWSLAQQRGKGAAKRVAPPEFEESATEDFFFENVFSVLKGPRPNFAELARGGGRQNGGAGGDDPGGTTDASVAGWAKIISAATIEDEIKALKLKMAENVTTPGEFKGRGYQVCRRDLTVAAMLFGIIHEYDGDVRFTESASGLRDVFARTAKNCKVGTNQVYNEAKQRKLDLDDIVGGARYQGKEGDPDMTWERICDRSPLMQRLETAQQRRLQPWLSSESEFKKNKDDIVREAELVSAISAVLMKESMEDAGDEDYDSFSKQMQDAGGDIVTAVKQNNYEAARTAASAIGQACTTCHENYRG